MNPETLDHRNRPNFPSPTNPGLNVLTSSQLLSGYSASKSDILALHFSVLTLFCSHFFQHKLFSSFPDQKCFWSQTKSRHGCYNLRWIICNHFSQRISWDASEINRFQFISWRDIFFATAITAAQQLKKKVNSYECQVPTKTIKVGG